MAEYMNKDRFLASMGLKGDETKYGNRDAEHQHRSYSTYMSYEIMDSVDDSIEEDVAPVVFCRNCVAHNRCAMERIYLSEGIAEPFCCRGERR